MTELVYALKKRYDKIYNETQNDGWCNEDNINVYYEINELIKKHIKKSSVNDRTLNLLPMIPYYDKEYIYMILLDYGYNFTNKIILFVFFLNFYKHLNKPYKDIVVELAINKINDPKISQYFGKEILITDKDIDEMIFDDKTSQEIADDIITVEHIFCNLQTYYYLVHCYFVKVNWSSLLNYCENNKIHECKQILKRYKETDYDIPCPTFKLELVKYKDVFDKYLARCDYIYDKTLNNIIDK